MRLCTNDRTHCLVVLKPEANPINRVDSHATIYELKPEGLSMSLNLRGQIGTGYQRRESCCPSILAACHKVSWYNKLTTSSQRSLHLYRMSRTFSDNLEFYFAAVL